MISNTNKTKKTSGFTIVELLIVIVVIGILAAITIVSYNGVQNKAKTANALSAANNVIKKSLIYSTDESSTGYPPSLAKLTEAAAAGKTYELTGVSLASPELTLTTTSPVPTSPTQVTYNWCGVLSTAPTGSSVIYYDYSQKKGVKITTGTGC